MEQGMTEYLANIEARDRREQAQKGIIDQCTSRPRMRSPGQPQI
jgi:hypothetical protein